MKNLCLFFICFLPMIVIAQSTYYHVIVDNPTDQFVTCEYIKKGETTPKFFKLKLRPTNELVFSFEIDQDQFIPLTYDNKTIELYVEVGDDAKMKFDATNLKSTLTFEGKGSVHNNYIATYNKSRNSKNPTVFKSRFLNVLVDASVPKKVNSHTPKQYAAGIQDWRVDRIAELNEVASNGDFSRILKNYYEEKIKYTAGTEEMMYMLYAHQNGVTSTVSSTPATDVRNINIQHPDGQNFLNSIVLANYIPGDFENPDKTLIYEQISDRLSGKAKYYMQATLMVNVYQKSNNANFAIDRFQKFKDENPYPELTKKVVDGLEGELQFMPEASAPDFEVVMDNGRKVKLSDYKGRVVYVSFWASWCKPCLQGFRKSQDIRKRLEQNGVVLLNVSIDKTEEKWRSSMAKENILGTNCLAANIDDMKRLYDIGSIPAYFIVDKKGKFAYLSDKQGRDIFEEFNKLVRE